MGCGKTLQAAAIMAAAAAESAARFAATGDPANAPLPSLVVCPSTLVAHWAHEICKYVEPGHLLPVPLLGGPGDAAVQRGALPGHAVVITSYESIRCVCSVLLGTQGSESDVY